MSPSTEHECAECHAKVVLRGARIFVRQFCPQCHAAFRVRESIGGYRLHAPLARNGFGIIFRATGPRGEEVAVKIIQPPFASDDEEAARFIAKIRALAELKNPHSLELLASGTECGAAWLAMPWLSRGSLAARLRERGRLPEAEVLAIGLGSAEILGAAAEIGQTHRDLEPNNFIFDAEDAIKVTDFAQAAFSETAADELGSVWGRTCYISPERLRNETEETPSDIYSLGAVLFHALTGRPPFDGEPHGQVVLELLERHQPRVENSSATIHEATARVLNRMLGSELEDRFERWSEVSAQLQEAARFVAQRDAPAPPDPADDLEPVHLVGRSPGWFWFWISVVLVVLILLATVAAWQHHLRT